MWLHKFQAIGGKKLELPIQKHAANTATDFKSTAKSALTYKCTSKKKKKEKGEKAD